MPAAAVADCDEIQLAAGCRVERRRQRGATRQGDRRRRQAAPGVGVVGRVGVQVAPAQVAVEAAAEAVDDGRIGLQAHADGEAPAEHAGDAPALVGDAGLLLDDRGQDQRLVGTGDDARLVASCPGLVERLAHRLVGLAEQVEVAGAAPVGVGLGQEPALRVLALAAQHRHHPGIGLVGDGLRQRRLSGQRPPQVGEGPALDDGEAVLDDAAARELVEQAARVQAGLQQVLARLQAAQHAVVDGQRLPPVPAPGRGQAALGQLRDDAAQRLAARHVQHDPLGGQRQGCAREALVVEPGEGGGGGQGQQEQQQRLADPAARGSVRRGHRSRRGSVGGKPMPRAARV